MITIAGLIFKRGDSFKCLKGRRLNYSYNTSFVEVPVFKGYLPFLIQVCVFREIRPMQLIIKICFTFEVR